MEGGEREEAALLPPGYVSLAQLQERWLKKQHEKKKVDERRGEEREKGGGGSVRNVAARNGGGMGVIEEKGKGKAIVIGGIENGEEEKKTNSRRKNRFRKKKFGGIEGKGKQLEKGKDRTEIKELDGGNGGDGKEIGNGELKGINEIANVGIVARNGVKGGISDVKRMDYRGRFGRNGVNRGRRNQLNQSKGKKMEDERESGRKLGEREGRKGDYQERYNRFKERRNGLVVGNGVEPVSEKKAGDEVLEVFSEKCGVSGGERNGKRERSKIKGDVVEGGGLSDDKVALEKKVNDEVLVVEKAENGEKGGVGKGYRGYGNWSGNSRYGTGHSRYGNWRGHGGEGRRYTRFGRFEYRGKIEHSESGKIWVKKEEKSGAEVGSSGN